VRSAGPTNALLCTGQRSNAHDHPRRVSRARSARAYGPVVGEAIGQVLSLGVGVALSPVPIMPAVFIAIASLGPGLPVAIYFALGARARHVLADLERWMGAHNAAIMVVLCLVIAASSSGRGSPASRDTTISGQGFDAARLGGVRRTIERLGLELVAVRSFVEGERAQLRITQAG
jgi:hypothetical protein